MKRPLRHGPATPLRTGYTTGACAAAAARGAALMLRDQRHVDVVEINLPAGGTARFSLHGERFSATEAACFVIKDAGDDPDVTNGTEVHALVMLVPFDSAQGTVSRLSGFEVHPALPLEGDREVTISGGAGIGRVTKPGLAVPPGEWAINPVPRRMITDAVQEVFPDHRSPFTLHVVISIPDGEERAKKTLNARLGILGGLSILGTTGIVRPISAKAWTDTIDAALDVAKACGCRTVVLSTGRSSELAAQRSLVDLPEEAYIMMGDHVAYALSACARRGFDRPIVACQFAKLLKIACGHENTHAAASELDLATLAQWAYAKHLPGHITGIIARANTAREIIIACGFDKGLLELVCEHAHEASSRHAHSLRPEYLVADYAGNAVFRGR
jgi:cobalt-precorrin-5B (C1)-methyltransferase